MNGQHARDTYLTATEFGPPGKPTGAAAVAGGIVTQGWPPLGQVARGFPDILFHQFWTRLCRTCEKIEQEKFDVLINTAAAAPGFVPQTEQARWNYPWNQCLCIKAIGWPGPTMQPPTLPGRNAAQPTLPPATGGAGGLRPRNCVGNTAIGVDSCYDSILDDLVARRDRNDLWLQRERPFFMYEALATWFFLAPLQRIRIREGHSLGIRATWSFRLFSMCCNECYSLESF
ncbi:unnamed protein product [Zymoseptoria tritici ST99CH_1E4]|uniref:Uncharacterized protein n=1 Tax=Zymoseptoria tritici ST99CH_1E4 TaxID=1276532 RepID=A0A2H1FX95_ZYMTR|nr:unnamed protein product [Zymoseptoria tritici ST99CH_1E4]